MTALSTRDCRYCKKIEVLDLFNGDSTTLKKCGRCQTAYYCNGECQLKDWPRHKLICASEQYTQLLNNFKYWLTAKTKVIDDLFRFSYTSYNKYKSKRGFIYILTNKEQINNLMKIDDIKNLGINYMVSESNSGYDYILEEYLNLYDPEISFILVIETDKGALHTRSIIFNDIKNGITKLTTKNSLLSIEVNRKRLIVKD